MAHDPGPTLRTDAPEWRDSPVFRGVRFLPVACG
jgi:hypothetical protein